MKKIINKRNIVIVIVFLIILVVVSMLVIKNYNKEKNNELEVVSKIKNKIDKKEDLLLYLTYNDDESMGANHIVNYYKKLLNLNLFNVRVDKLKKGEYEKIVSFVDDRKNYVAAPALIFVKEGRETAVVNNISTERVLYEFLYLNKYISEEQYNIQKLLNEDNLDDVYGSDNYKLILFTNPSQSEFVFREKLYNLAKLNKFEYYINYWDVDKDGYKEIIENVYNFTFIAAPKLVVVKSNKVIDNFDTNNINKLEDFLKKYEFIK